MGKSVRKECVTAQFVFHDKLHTVVVHNTIFDVIPKRYLLLAGSGNRINNFDLVFSVCRGAVVSIIANFRHLRDSSKTVKILLRIHAF